MTSQRFIHMEYVKLIVLLWTISSLHLLVVGDVKFTNLKCECIEKAFCRFDACHIKAVNRSYSYLYSKCVLLKTPITNVSVRFDISKRASGYRPFLYNVTVDACKFLRNMNSNKVTKFFYEIMRPFTNMNHTCPYDHDLIIGPLPTNQLNNRFTKVLPFPLGDYRIETNWYAYGVQMSYWIAYFSLT